MKISTVDDALFKELDEHWEDSNVDEDYSDRLISSISAVNVSDWSA